MLKKFILVKGEYLGVQDKNILFLISGSKARISRPLRVWQRRFFFITDGFTLNGNSCVIWAVLFCLVTSIYMQNYVFNNETKYGVRILPAIIMFSLVHTTLHEKSKQIFCPLFTV